VKTIMAKKPKTLTQSEKRAMKLIEYMMENYPEYHYSHSDWIVDEPENPFFGEHRRIFKLDIETDLVITVDADFQAEEVGKLVSITIRYVFEELKLFDWTDIKILFR